MWTFSTLGWPEKTSDLRTYHPTSLMAPGYEILFFWVARMILMSGCLLGEIPFRTVYLHGIVRDKQGKKFSKSSGHALDPLELADKYGADALRMALIAGAAPGNDVQFDENRVKGYRNFSTKIWNVARFVLLNKPPQTDADKTRTAADIAGRPEIKEFEAIKSEITKHLDEYELHLASEKIYHYFWHTFADKIIEQEKANLRTAADKTQTDADIARRAESYALLGYILVGSLKLLHPFMPFVTEEIYQKFELNKLLLTEKW